MDRKIQGNERCAKADLYRTLECISSPCFELNRDLEIVYVNSAFLSVSGLDTSDLVSVKITDLANNAAESFESALHADGSDLCNIKNAGLIFNGKHFSAGIAINKIYEESGSVSGLLCVLQGVTRADAEVSLIKEMRKLRAVCIFTGGAAHDYNNALTAVMGNLSLAKLEAESNQELIDLLKDAETASNRIRQLTEKIAMFTRAVKVTKVKCDVSALIMGQTDVLSAGYKGRCTVNADKDIPAVEIDKDLIGEAYACILENAFEAAPSGEGDIKINISRIDVKDGKKFPGSPVAEGDYISVSITDNGHGFDRNNIINIFEPYFTTKEGRDGIGLALAYSILKRHRGFIAADLPEKGGAVFTMFIPLF